MPVKQYPYKIIKVNIIKLTAEVVSYFISTTFAIAMYGTPDTPEKGK